jgi:hypothetical protein
MEEGVVGFDPRATCAGTARRLSGQALEWLPGEGIVRIYGPIRPGPGIHPAWPLHLDPTYAQPVPSAGSVGCTSRPPGSREEAEALQGGQWVMLCPWSLDLMAVEQVPSWYLEELTNAESSNGSTEAKWAAGGLP